ncbi:hypothetical protein BC937DRAFT_93320 [Endogone sp. FLAS-F59071]|nr:hypothetical protein BC937DRAFT_93320 [Endogone sp. FLAS-F59071]|eukprot:RUS23376.1 hypothetical protein BC937DRAFT_93320 [Endogone sp. FLAS-F59071]
MVPIEHGKFQKPWDCQLELGVSPRQLMLVLFALSVHTSGNGAEPLLPSGIPDLELDALAIKLDGADFKVNADGCDEGGITDQEQFDEVVVGGAFCCGHILGENGQGDGDGVEERMRVKGNN